MKNTMSEPLLKLSPLDGRYESLTKSIAGCFSEKALIIQRVKIEIEYLIALGDEPTVIEPEKFTEQEKTGLRNIYKNFSTEDAKSVKQIEAETNHDIKAVEYFLRTKTDEKIHPWIHFALTSEDVNNLAYTLMWKNGLSDVFLPKLEDIQKQLDKMAKTFSAATMLAMTHGQPALPTTFGKELTVFYKRIERQLNQLLSHTPCGKLNGAVGTWAAHSAAYPQTDWVQFSTSFVDSLGLEPNLITTQIEPHDSLVESIHQIIRVNTILLDLCRDFWLYISRGILTQKKVATEIGSSTMPQKINPIQFENAEGNLGMSNALFNHFAEKLPVSRMQRDLSDSTVQRNLGTALGYTYIALENIQLGLTKIDVNPSQMEKEIERRWEVLGEAVQTLLRKSGNPDAYEILKEKIRGKQLTDKKYKELVKSLPLAETDKKRLLELTPKNYLGLAKKLVK